jgi:hypothetical protein
VSEHSSKAEGSRKKKKYYHPCNLNHDTTWPMNGPCSSIAFFICAVPSRLGVSRRRGLASSTGLGRLSAGRRSIAQRPKGAVNKTSIPILVALATKDMQKAGNDEHTLFIVAGLFLYSTN